MRNALIAAAFGGVVVCTLLAAFVVGSVLGLGVGVPGFSGVGGGYEETTLYQFNTAGPACPTAGPTPNSNSNSNSNSKEGVYSRPTDDGRRLSLVDNVTVEGDATGLDASLSEIGPGRYHLSLHRTEELAWNGTCERPAELQYNATLNVSEPNDYTVIVTLDGELRGVHWSESTATGGAAGSSQRASGGSGGHATGSAGGGNGDGSSGDGEGNASDGSSNASGADTATRADGLP